MFDIFDQKIYFHKNQNKIKEYLIPDGYEIKYWNEKCTIRSGKNKCT